ncbi:MAG TPA: alkaline phosphatase family protein [Thermoanaerobaculia bacterium]|nr:alkaline phosphatase family protein [Thermoanaerobaculia bacterium]
MRRSVVLLLLSLLACAPATPPRVAPPAPRFEPAGVAQRVVLMTFDGLGADELARQTALPAFEHLARTGAVARVIPVNPTLTGPTHVSILTGVTPQVHGIVSNWFHLPGTPVERVTRGMDLEPDTETLLDAAKRSGKRVGVVPFPTLEARTPRGTADFGLVWTSSLTRGRIVQLTRSDFKREWVPPTWTARPARRTSYSPIMRARVEWAATKTLRADVDVVAYDRTDDGRENYDTYTIEIGEDEQPLDAKRWFAVAKENHGSWSKLLEHAPSLDVKLYWGPISRTRAYPESYRDLLDAAAGFWPGAPDEQSDIDPATFAEQMERLADFITRAQTLTLQRMQFDLLLMYQPVIDTAQHNFLGYDDTVIRRAFVAADRGLASVGSRLDASRDALIVTGDHGLVAVDRAIRINTFLAQKGFAPRWRAYTSNNVAHLYRFSGDDDSEALIGTLQATGWFERIERKTHRNSGDVVVTSLPGISLSDSFQEPVETERASYGHHGALNTHRELHTVLFAGGAGITPGNAGEIQQTEIAGFVKRLLGLVVGVIPSREDGAGSPSDEAIVVQPQGIPR